MLLGDRNRSVRNTWRNLVRWPVVGFQSPFTIDARIVALWFLGYFADPFKFLAVVVTAYFSIGLLLRLPTRYIAPRLRHIIRGQRLSSLPKYYSRGLIQFALIAITCGFIFQATPVYADFRVVVPEVEAAKKNADDNSTMPSTIEDMAVGFGHDLPLRDAVDMILPGDWKAIYTPTNLGEKHVNWRADNKTVRQVLVQVANQSASQFTADTGAGVIHFKTVPTGKVMSLNGLVDDQRRRKFILRAGHKLSNELARWAEESHFQFHWGLETDYMVPLEAMFEGSYVDAVKEVFDTYRRQGGLGDARLIPGSRNGVVAITKAQ